MSLVSFHEVGLTFANGTTALERVNLSVEAGEFVTIVGPSGCGKSTLLRVAAGLETATAGTCRVSTDQLGYVFQDATLLPWRSVAGNVALPAELERLPRQERDSLVQRAIDLVGLSGFEDQLPRTLSGGMSMRASLARALTLNPRFFLFDEPFGALDEITRQRLNDELSNLFLQQGFGALFITHSVSEAVYLSSRVLVMSGRPGTIVASFEVPFGYPRDPDVRFDAAFAELVGDVSNALRQGHR